MTYKSLKLNVLTKLRILYIEITGSRVEVVGKELSVSCKASYDFINIAAVTSMLTRIDTFPLKLIFSFWFEEKKDRKCRKSITQCEKMNGL